MLSCWIAAIITLTPFICLMWHIQGYLTRLSDNAWRRDHLLSSWRQLERQTVLKISLSCNKVLCLSNVLFYWSDNCDRCSVDAPIIVIAIKHNKVLVKETVIDTGRQGSREEGCDLGWHCHLLWSKVKVTVTSHHFNACECYISGMLSYLNKCPQE